MNKFKWLAVILAALLSVACSEEEIQKAIDDANASEGTETTVGSLEGIFVSDSEVAYINTARTWGYYNVIPDSDVLRVAKRIDRVNDTLYLNQVSCYGNVSCASTQSGEVAGSAVLIFGGAFNRVQPAYTWDEIDENTYFNPDGGDITMNADQSFTITAASNCSLSGEVTFEGTYVYEVSATATGCDNAGYELDYQGFIFTASIDGVARIYYFVSNADTWLAGFLNL